jgi:very-short-patch-repair endonuclease
VRELAELQHGVVTRAQVRDLGVSDSSVSRRLAGGLWDRVLPGVFRITGAVGDPRQLPMAATLWAGDGSVVSHATAARLWEIDGVRERKIELWVPSKRNLRNPSVHVHRGTRIDRADRSTSGPLPITTPIRTLIDISARMEEAALLAAMENLIRRHLATPERLAVRLEALRSSGRPGAGRLADLLASRAGPALESVLEAKVWQLIGRTGLPLPQRQHWVSLPGGRARLDFAWPEQRVALECDGWEHHGRRSAFAPDRARLAELASARWHVLPVTWHAVTAEPARVERWIRDSLAQDIRRADTTVQ